MNNSRTRFWWSLCKEAKRLSAQVITIVIHHEVNWGICGTSSGAEYPMWSPFREQTNVMFGRSINPSLDSGTSIPDVCLRPIP